MAFHPRRKPRVRALKRFFFNGVVLTEVSQLGFAVNMKRIAIRVIIEIRQEMQIGVCDLIRVNSLAREKDGEKKKKKVENGPKGQFPRKVGVTRLFFINRGEIRGMRFA